jgi:hypothetical protein
MKKFLNEDVGFLADTPVASFMLSGMVTIIAVMVGLLPIEMGYGELLDSLARFHFSLFLGGGFAMLLAHFVPAYLKWVSEGVVDKTGKIFALFGRPMTAVGVFSIVNMLLSLTMLSLTVVLVFVLAVPFWVSILLIGTVGLGFAIHFGLKFTFRIWNRLTQHESDPNAHQKSE